MRAVAHHRYTWSDYLEYEDFSSEKHEYLDGEIYAMAGGTPEHALLAGRVVTVLGAQLRRKACKVYTSDLRIRVMATGLTTYPDVSVICGKVEVDPTSKLTAINPTLLVEVLSPSTEDYDRGTKFEHYQQIPSLKEYVLVSQRECLIEVFHRRGARWMRAEARRAAAAQLEAIGCELSVDEVYEGVTPAS